MKTCIFYAYVLGHSNVFLEFPASAVAGVPPAPWPDHTARRQSAPGAPVAPRPGPGDVSKRKCLRPPRLGVTKLSISGLGGGGPSRGTPSRSEGDPAPSGAPETRPRGARGALTALPNLPDVTQQDHFWLPSRPVRAPALESLVRAVSSAPPHHRTMRSKLTLGPYGLTAILLWK